MIRLRHILLICLGSLLIVIIIPSCKKDYLVVPEGNIPDTVKFSVDIVPIFNTSCNNANGCHATSGGVAPDLSPENGYANLLMYGLLDTADAESSILYSRINSTTKPMPPEGKLPQNKLDLVLVWINQGAQNN